SDRERGALVQVTAHDRERQHAAVWHHSRGAEASYRSSVEFDDALVRRSSHPGRGSVSPDLDDDEPAFEVAASLDPRHHLLPEVATLAIRQRGREIGLLG